MDRLIELVESVEIINFFAPLREIFLLCAIWRGRISRKGAEVQKREDAKGMDRLNERVESVEIIDFFAALRLCVRSFFCARNGEGGSHAKAEGSKIEKTQRGWIG